MSTTLPELALKSYILRQDTYKTSIDIKFNLLLWIRVRALAFACGLQLHVAKTETSLLSRLSFQ